MTPEERFPDDAVLRRVAAARPAIREEDLSPTSDRGAAIADRVLRAHRPIDAAPAPRTTRWSLRTRRRPFVLSSLGLAAAAACVVLVLAAVLPGARNPAVAPRSQIPDSRPTADLINIHLVPAPGSASRLSLGRFITRTPLGALISREYRLIQENVQTGSTAQNRIAIAHLTSNQIACERAATAVRQVHARPGQRAVKRYWVHGIRLQATGDQQLITALRAADAGNEAIAKRELDVASTALDQSDLFTAYAQNALRTSGSPGPLPPLLRRFR